MPTCNAAPISAKGKRDSYIDGIRGTLHIILLLDHLAILLPVLFGFWSAFFEPLGFFSFAEAFVFLSGYVSGLVYTRIYRERGKAALVRKAFARCGTVYSCYVVSVVILLCFAKCLQQELVGWRYWDQLLTCPLPTAAYMVATLSCNPLFLEILPMYAMFLMFTPLIVILLERKHRFVVIACSFLVWFAAQYAIGSEKGGLSFLNGAIFTGCFSPLGWQTLFIIGLLCGHKTYDSNGPWLPRHPLCVLPVFCITIGLYMLRHSATGMSIGQEWAAGSTMGPLRLLNFLSVAFAVAYGRDLLQKAVSWRGFEFLSRHSLQVFAFHLMPICLLTSLISSKTPISVSVQCAAFLFCVAWLFLTAALASLFGTGRHRMIEFWKNHCRCEDYTEPNNIYPVRSLLKNGSKRLFAINGKLFNQVPMLLYAALGLGLSLFGATLAFSSNGFFSHFFQEIVDFIQDPQTQWLILSCLCFYFTTLMLLQPRQQKASFWRLNTWELWVIAAFIVAAFSYVVDYPASMQSAQPLILFASATLGKGASVLTAFKSRKSEGESGNKPEHCRNNLAVLVASLLVILLALASIWGTNAGRGFGYDGNARCSGPWDNPNIFGLLMGTGIALAVGFLLQSPMSKAKTQKVEVGKYTVVILCLLAGILMARGLLHSYSRGAWVATVCGLGYLVWRGGQALKSKGQRHSCISQLNRNWLPFSVILASFFLLVFWHFRQTNWLPARRALSVVNTTDFSWRNRIVAWEGNLQIMAEHPWLGTGWNQPELLYDHYYLPSKLEDSAAIEMNDYFLFGATLGIPALFCFGMYLYLSLARKSEMVNRQDANSALDIGNWTLDWPKAICRAGTIILLVGFWFDGGLFELPTASTFWILLELGNIRHREPRE